MAVDINGDLVMHDQSKAEISRRKKKNVMLSLRSEAGSPKPGEYFN